MSAWMIWALWIVGAYLVGGIPFGFLIGKLRGVDVRTVGSKNIGATNVFRTVGKGWGLVAFALDVSKGLVPVLLAKWFIAHNSSLLASHFSLALAVGITCVLGHMLTPYMKFKGGKGVATAFGMLLGLVPALVGVAFALFAVTVWISHYISLGSIFAASFLMITIWIPGFLGTVGWHDLAQAIMVTLIAAFVIWKHRANIGRLCRGCENKIY